LNDGSRPLTCSGVLCRQNPEETDIFFNLVIIPQVCAISQPAALAVPGIPAECSGQNGSKIRKKTQKRWKKVSIFCANPLANIWKIQEKYLEEKHLLKYSKHSIIGNQ